MPQQNKKIKTKHKKASNIKRKIIQTTAQVPCAKLFMSRGSVSTSVWQFQILQKIGCTCFKIKCTLLHLWEIQQVFTQKYFLMIENNFYIFCILFDKMYIGRVYSVMAGTLFDAYKNKARVFIIISLFRQQQLLQFIGIKEYLSYILTVKMFY